LVNSTTSDSVNEGVIKVETTKEEATKEETTESETDEFGNVIEPDTGVYYPEDLDIIE
jgi:hypothetical protein